MESWRNTVEWGYPDAMSERRYVILEGRGVLRVDGPDARPFLQGMISNDIGKLTAEQAIYAAFLTPQGKFLSDFFITARDGTLLFDCEASRLSDLFKRFMTYRLRSRVELTDASAEYMPVALFGPGTADALELAEREGAARPLEGGVVYMDPRLAELGGRALLPKAAGLGTVEAAGFVAGSPEDYERLRLSCGVPDGSRDMIVEKAILLENGLEELNGIDFEKGCFIGQELTARTKYRALIRKRLFRVEIDGPLPPPGTPIRLGEREAGEMRSGLDGLGLALLRLDQVAKAKDEDSDLVAGGARLRAIKPDWARF
jgi:folate-binding protein YgfZ